MRFRNRFTLAAAVGALLAFGAVGVEASPVSVTLPYSQDFSGVTAPALPPEYSTASSGAQGGAATPVTVPFGSDNALQLAMDGSSGESLAYVTDNAGAIGHSAGTSFSFSSQFTIASLATQIGAAKINLFVFDNSASDPNTGTTGYELTFNIGDSTGTMAFTELGSSSFSAGSATGSITAPSPTIADDPTYTLTISGTYISSTDLNLTASVFDGTNTKSITATDTAAYSDLTGDNIFALRFAVQSNMSGSVNADNVSLTATPEPASLAIFAVAIPGMLARRRRRPRFMST